MKIHCPSCGYSAEVDPAKTPPNGTKAKCPRCFGHFIITPENVTETITCPKCGQEQEPSESCSRCGIIYGKYRAAEERKNASTAAAEDCSADAGQLPRHEPDGQKASRGDILAWADAGLIVPENIPLALSLAGLTPGSRDWRRFLDLLTLWLGAVFLAAGVIFFFAYNWKEMGRFAKFGIAEALLLAAAVSSWRLGLERISGNAALLVATLLTGALLALVEQTYQAGADNWELFFRWALLVLPWVVISRFAPLWLVWLLLVNLATGLYGKTPGPFGFMSHIQSTLWSLAVLNTLALVVWELAAGKEMPWLLERWEPRIVAAAGMFFVTFLAVCGITDPSISGGAEFLAYAACLGGTYVVYRRHKQDLYMLTQGVLSLIVVITTFLGHNLARSGDAGTFLFIGMVVLGLSAAGGWWLRSVGREVAA
jgi:predicted Zn finger-like uncharacterized protein